MNKAGEIFENAILHWRDRGGVGSAIIPPPLNDKVMVLGILQRIYARSPTTVTVILVNDFQERREIIDFITHQEDDENNEEFKKLIDDKYLKLFTLDFASKTRCFNPHLFICYRPLAFTDTILEYLQRSRYKLVVLNKFQGEIAKTVDLFKYCPLLDDFKANELEELRLSTPVEEYQIGVDIDETSTDFINLAKYNDYITTSINIFGNFDYIQQARTGNAVLNISASQICAQIAQDNGWNEQLDMSIDFNVEIDRLYNPIQLRERATQTYDIIRRRSQLLSDYDHKLQAIFDIVNENPNKKILIISKRGEFASQITEYLNCAFGDEVCGNYHDKVLPIPMKDKDNNVICYKSGAKKGQPRLMASQAQKTSNEKLFNMDLLSVLSTSNSPDKELNIAVDIIIITSPQCESIKSYMYRLGNVSYNNNKLTLYSIFCKNTLEERLLENKEQTYNQTVINKCEKCVITENISDFVVVD